MYPETGKNTEKTRPNGQGTYCGNVPCQGTYGQNVPCLKTLENKGKTTATGHIGYVGHVCGGRCMGDKMNDDFDVNGFLAGMFSEPKAGDVTTTTTPPAAAPEPLTTTRGDGRPAVSIIGTDNANQDLGDLMMPDGEWDSLPSPTPCPRCGSIDAWWDCWGQRRCERCEPSGQRSMELANRAARLRGKR